MTLPYLGRVQEAPASHCSPIPLMRKVYAYQYWPFTGRSGDIIEPCFSGLFHKAIMESGFAHSPWALNGNLIWYNSSKASAIGSKCVSEAEWDSGNFTDGKLGDCLRNMTAINLVALGYNVCTTVNPIIVPNCILRCKI